MIRSLPRLPLLVLAGLLAGSTLSACAPVLVGGAVVTGLAASDRRTTGAQIEDERIEMRGASRLRETLGERAHINITSYNRQVLLSGEVPTEQDKQQAEQIVARVENVRAVVNELGVMPASSLSQRSSDALTTGRVKSNLIDAKDLQSNAFKVVTERGVTYLMGRVTLREADRATDLARRTSGVQKVVKLFEIVSEEDLLEMQQPAASAPPASKPANAPSY